VETYYRMQMFEGFALSLDYQYVVHPAYNAQRGPVMAFGLRVHAEK
jgi:high affinity Mn2+ porin